MTGDIKVPIKIQPEYVSDGFGGVKKKAAKSGEIVGESAGDGFSRGFKKEIKTSDIFKGAFAANVAADLARGFGRAVASGISNGVQGLRDFGRGIAEINSLLPANSKLTRASSEALLGFTTQFGTSQTEQTRAFYSIVSAGVKGTAKQLRTLKVANEAATAGLVDVGTSANLLVSSVNAYSKAGLTATRASDILFTAVKEGQTTFGALSQFLGSTTSLASNAGIEFNELAGVIAFLTKKGLDTGRATTGIKGFIKGIIKPSKEAQDASKKMGLELSTTALRAKGLAGFMKDLGRATKGSEVELAKLFPDVEALSSIMSIVNGDLTDFNRILKETDNSAGATSRAAAALKDSLDFDMKRFEASSSRLFTTLSKTLEPSLRTFFQTFTGGIEKLTSVIRTNGPTITSAIKNIVEPLLITPAKFWIDFFDGGNSQGISSMTKQINGLEKEASRLQATITKNKDNTLANSFLGNQQENKERFAETIFQISELKRKRQELITLQNEEKADPLAPVGGEGDPNKIIPDPGEDGSPEVAKDRLRSLSETVSGIGAGFALTQQEATANLKLIDSDMKKVAASSIFLGQSIKKGIGQGIGSGFAAFGKALVNGENALDAFVKSFLGALGTMMIQQGTMFILQGLGFSVIPGLQASGGTLIAAGAALAVAGGALSAVASGSGAGAGAGGGVGAGGGIAEDIGGFGEEDELQATEVGTSVSVVVEGNILNTEESARSIVEAINDSFETNGLILNQGLA